MILGKGARSVLLLYWGHGCVVAKRQHKLAESVFLLAWLLRGSELH